MGLRYKQITLLSFLSLKQIPDQYRIFAGAQDVSNVCAYYATSGKSNISIWLPEYILPWQQGRTEGANGEQCRRNRMTRGRWKGSTMSQELSSIPYIHSQMTKGSDMEVPNLFLARPTFRPDTSLRVRKSSMVTVAVYPLWL